MTLSSLLAAGVKDPDKWLSPIEDALKRFSIDTPIRSAMFLAQCAHESAGFTRLEENLNYSAEGLLKTWPKRFDATMAQEYAHKPELIANRVYALRMGNGDPSSGDGWKFRGRGLLPVSYTHLTLPTNREV